MRSSNPISMYGSIAYFLASIWLGTAFAGSSSTTLSVTKTASGTITQTDTYSWSIQKSTPPNQVTYVLPLGQNVAVPFTITATQTGPVVASVNVASGNVCVTNTGLFSTVGLQIIDTLEFLNGTVWQAVSGGQQALAVSADLASGATQCYPYQFNGLLSPAFQYRNQAEAFIDNYSGHEGTSFGTTVTVPLVVSTVSTPIDATATLSDVFPCPTGLTCVATALPVSPLTGSTLLNYVVTITNASLPCGQTVSLLNTATLVQNSTQTTQNASAGVQVYTGTCPIIPPVTTAPSLGTAAGFAVLGASTVTNTGASIVTGELGVSPGTAITGFPPGSVVGAVHAGDAVALQAQSDAVTAYSILAGQVCDVMLTGQDLGGLTLTPGTYCFTTTAQLTGALTLNAQGNPNAVFIFKMGSTLTTAALSSVTVVNGGSSCNVFWQVGTSATLGANTAFDGNILAQASITLGAGANIIGRAIATTAAVTMDTNNVSQLTCGP